MNVNILSISSFLLILTFTQNSENANILGVFPMPAPSHFILGSTLMKGLANRGHNVTIIGSYSKKFSPQNGSYQEIELTEFRTACQSKKKDISFDLGNTSPFTTIPLFMEFLLNTVELTLNDTKVQKLLNSSEKFDVVIVEQSLNDVHKGFASHFNAPLILLNTIGANAWINIPTGNSAPTSYVPDARLGFSTQMTFYERFVNNIMFFYSHLLHHFYFYPKQDTIYKKYFKGSFYDDLYNASLTLLNSHPSINHPVPQVPSMINIGGFHIQPPKDLPQDLKKFLDEATEGVVYFSMGSHLKSSFLPHEKVDAFLKSFGNLKEQVLWKWEKEFLPGKPENVKIQKWLPQQDLLAHRNIKLFITHGGLLSTTEAVYHGVPVLAIPITSDQRLNARQIVKQGFGLSLDYGKISEDEVTEKINEILKNPKYLQTAKKKSEIFHDRLVKPLDEAIYWVEYVIKHKGAPHLKVDALNLRWYQYFLLDIILVAVIVLVISVTLLYMALSKLFTIAKIKLD